MPNAQTADRIKMLTDRSLGAVLVEIDYLLTLLDTPPAQVAPTRARPSRGFPPKSDGYTRFHRAMVSSVQQLNGAGGKEITRLRALGQLSQTARAAIHNEGNEAAVEAARSALQLTRQVVAEELDLRLGDEFLSSRIASKLAVPVDELKLDEAALFLMQEGIDMGLQTDGRTTVSAGHQQAPLVGLAGPSFP